MSIKAIAKKLDKNSLILEIEGSKETIKWPISSIDQPLEIGSSLIVTIEPESTSANITGSTENSDFERKRKLLEDLVN